MVIGLYCSHSPFSSAFQQLKQSRPPQPGWWTGCRNTTELFLISTACTEGFPHVFYVPVEYMSAGKTQQGYFVFFFWPPSTAYHFPFLPPPSFSLCFPASLLCVSAWKWNRSFWIFSSITKTAPLLVMQSRQRSTGIWHVSSNVGSERRSAAFCMQAGLA